MMDPSHLSHAKEKEMVDRVWLERRREEKGGYLNYSQEEKKVKCNALLIYLVVCF